MSNSPTRKQTGLYRRLLGYAFQYKTFFQLSLFGFLLYASMEGLLVVILKYFVDGLGGLSVEPLPLLPAAVVNSLYFVPIAVIVLTLLRGIGGYLGNFYMSKVGLNVVNALRKAMFNHMLYLPQNFYDSRNSGELVSLINYNVEQVTGSVTNALKIVFRDGLSVCAFLGVMLYYNWLLTLIFFVVAPLLGGLVFFAGQYFRKTSQRLQTAVGKVTHVATETFQGMRLVKSYNGENYEAQRFAAAADDSLKLNTKFERVKALQTPVLHFVIACALAVILFLVMLVWTGSPGDAVSYITAAGAIAKPFRELSTVNAVIQRGMAAAESIFATLDHQQEPDLGNTVLDKVAGKIEFRDVCFTYGGDRQALDHLNLSIEPGETVALVGASGSGKTTIASLLLRFYRADSGTITIDGTSIDEISTESLRRNIALVNQQTILFNDSVSANIAYGKSGADSTPADVERAAEHAYATQFIEALEQGFATPVGEDGARLSGGQRQRIAIARALLKNAPILILDEATSALDNESEKQIQLALEQLTSNRTTLVIAHRLSTIENADKIVVLENGKVVEIGDHHSLIAKGGAYAQLHRTLGATS